METPSNLPLLLMASFNAIVSMPGDHNILIPVKDAIFRLPVENIYLPKEDVFQFLRIEHISATCIIVYMK